MEQNKFFLAVNRITSVLLLLLVIGAIITVAVSAFIGNDWDRGNTIEVVDQEGNKTLSLRLGRLEEMTGHDVQTIKLSTDTDYGSLGSGYDGGETRNVLFLSGKSMDPHWLYDTNNYLIDCFCRLRKSENYSDEEPVIALYIGVVKADTNGDGKLSKKDGITLALANPDGTGYAEIASGIGTILDSNVTDSGRAVSFLLQIGNEILLKTYSLETFELEAERSITEISKTL